MKTEILQFIGGVLAYGGGGAVVAYLLFQWLGKTWIENKFAAKLKDLEHDHAVAVARLRVEVESMLGGALKIQERDFKVLPETWEKLDEAYGLVRWLVSPMQQHVNVRQLNEVQLDELLASQPWTESQKQDVRIADRRDRQKVHDDIEFWYRLDRVKRAVGAYQRNVAANAIFYPASLKTKLREMETHLSKAITAKEVGKEAEDYKLQGEGWTKLSEEAPRLREAIESEIRERLESHMRATQRTSA